VISAGSLERRLDGLDTVGSGLSGVNRLAWTEEDARSRAWFTEQAKGLGRTVVRDPAGNLWACPPQAPPWWGVGSHLDSVREGGRYDGPLGVACAFEIAARTEQPVAVISFADEEGARFNTPTFGSKALTGRLDLPHLLERRDPEGVVLGDAMRDAGVDPGELAGAPQWLSKLTGFVEIHIDQTTELARAGQPVGIVSALANRLRLQVTLRGQADHAGATPLNERRDALSAAARLIVTAEDLASGEVKATTSRILAEPNAPTTIASRVRLWIDARAPGAEAIDRWLDSFTEAARELAARSRVEIGLEVASRSLGREFSPRLRSGLAGASDAVLGHRVSELVCFAGHDAGVLAERIPAAMVLVRNPTGISHSPRETVDLEDAALAARVVQGLIATADRP
jgi:N-carbamoyl-L-amino-acid hydrolase